MHRSDVPALSDGGADTQADAAMCLPAMLDLTAADGLHAQIVDRIGRDGALLLDGRDVVRVSTPCLQVLLAAGLRARAAGQPFALQAASAVLHDAVRDLGLLEAMRMEEP